MNNWPGSKVHLLIKGETHKVPFEVAEYVIDLHQALMSVHTRVKKEKRYFVGNTFQEKPAIVDKPVIKRIELKHK